MFILSARFWFGQNETRRLERSGKTRTRRALKAVHDNSASVVGDAFFPKDALGLGHNLAPKHDQRRINRRGRPHSRSCSH